MAVERGTKANDRAEAFAPGASVCEVARRRDVVAGQIYRWRNELQTAAAGFTEVVIAPEPSERGRTDASVLEIEFGRDIRVLRSGSRIFGIGDRLLIRVHAHRLACACMSRSGMPCRTRMRPPRFRAKN